MVFCWEPALWTHRIGCGGGWCKKNHAILSNKQWLLSIDMKTKVVQHVPGVNIFIFFWKLYPNGRLWFEKLYPSIKSNFLDGQLVRNGPVMFAPKNYPQVSKLATPLCPIFAPPGAPPEYLPKTGFSGRGAFHHHNIIPPISGKQNTGSRFLSLGTNF